MRVLITGGAGFIGSHAAELFAAKDMEVIVLDNLMRSRLFGYEKKSVEYNWEYLSSLRNVKLIKGDIRSKEDVMQALGQGVDVVIHAAGQPGVGQSLRDPWEDYSINAFGTLNILECIRQKSPDAVVIYTSTNKVYGENVIRIPIVEQEKRYVYHQSAGVNEMLPVDGTGHSPYGASKYVGDIYTQEYAYSYGLRTAVFRMSCIYGIRQFGFEDQGWVAWFVIAALTGKTITIFGDGKQVRDVLWVRDLIKAFSSFIEGKTESSIFNIGGGGGNTISLLELIDFIQERTGKECRVKFSRWRSFDQKVYFTDNTKVSASLGWQPEVNWRKGVGSVINWVQKNIKQWES